MIRIVITVIIVIVVMLRMGVVMGMGVGVVMGIIGVGKNSIRVGLRNWRGRLSSIRGISSSAAY